MDAANPLLQPWAAPYALPPFAALRPEHFAPALRAAMQQHRAELDAMAAQPEPATFDNTLARFDASGCAAGYGVYLRAEVLDADAFDAFVEAGDPFDAGVATRLKRHIDSAGDSVEPARPMLHSAAARRGWSRC